METSKKNYESFICRLEEACNDPNKKPELPLINKSVVLVWLGRNSPHEAEKVSNTWKTHNPSFEVKIWRDKESEAIVKQVCKERKAFNHLVEAWKKADSYAEKSDIVRLCILYKYGGIYVDTDLPCKGAIDELVYYTDFFIGIEQTDHSVSDPNNDVGIIYVGNAVIGCCKEHPLIKRALEKLQPNKTKKPGKESIISRTGPGLLTDQVYFGLQNDKRNHTMTTLVLPPAYFYPLPSGKRGEVNKNGVNLDDFVLPYSKGIHLWNLSWG